MLYAENGVIMQEQNFINGKTEGEQKYYYPDGSLEAIANHINGEAEGIRKEFYENSGIPKAEYLYVNGIKGGRYKIFYENGNLREEGHIEANHKVYVKEYDCNGQLKTIRERKLDGSWEILEQH